MNETRRYSMPIRDWPEGDRPREKLLSHGPDALTDAELLAIMLRTGDGASGQSALDHARALLNKFGSFEELERAGVGEICAIPGIGPAKAAAIKASLAIGRRLAAGKHELDEPVTSPVAVFKRLHAKIGNLNKETFWALLLDQRGRVIKEVRISEGSLTEALVHPREVFQPAVRECAARIIFAHNHPSGDPKPSPADIELNERLKKAGELLGIKVLDHVVIARESYRCILSKEEEQDVARFAAESDEE